MSRNARRLPLALVAMLILVVLAQVPGAGAGGDQERGATVFALAGGCGCHTLAGGPVGAGGRELATPFGTFYSTNITPDPDTGIGRWADDDVVAAIREGYARGKGVEAPVMPYYLYAGMADDDARDLVAYLRSLPAARRENREPTVSFPLPRLAYRAWRLLFAPRVIPPATAPRVPVDRGRYLADHVAICPDCHTARGRLGAPIASLYLAGTTDGPGGKSVPNITPHSPTGIGDWDVDDIAQVLKMGMLPNFDNVQGLMAEVVDGIGGGPGYARAPDADLQAIAAYLKTVAPVDHDVESR